VKQAGGSTPGKLLVLFVFHEVNDRVRQFIEKAIFQDENVDFVIISNDKANKFDSPDYVKKIFRDNVGYDFGGWSEALLTGDLYKKYDNFIFVNSSVIGPFLPPDFKGKWTDMYVNGLRDNVKLFGSTINALNDPVDKAHVQSYIFSVNKETLEYLIQCGIFSTTKLAKSLTEAVYNNEVGMSRKIIEKGWNIGSLMKYYDGVDFTFKTKKPSDYGKPFLGDIMYGHFRGTLWQDNELVFIKGNRM
jgi:lipopolysaccharide biosynthesis protein